MDNELNKRVHDWNETHQQMTGVESELINALHSALREALSETPEPVAIADGGVVNWIDGMQFEHECELFTSQPKTLTDAKDLLKWCEENLNIQQWGELCKTGQPARIRSKP